MGEGEKICNKCYMGGNSEAGTAGYHILTENSMGEGEKICNKCCMGGNSVTGTAGCYILTTKKLRTVPF